MYFINIRHPACSKIFKVSDHFVEAVVLVSLLLTLNIYHTLFSCFVLLTLNIQLPAVTLKWYLTHSVGKFCLQSS